MRYVSFLFGCVFGVIFFALVTLRVLWAIDANRNCVGHLGRAANSNTIEIAKAEMQTAVNYCREQRWTTGYTSVLFNTPDEDVEFWYKNLEASLDELNSVPPNANQLYKSNLLMKLRDTLTDNGSKGTEIIYPTGISIYPYNELFFWSFVLSAIFSLGCLFFAIAAEDW